MNLQNYKSNFAELNTQQSVYLADRLGIDARDGNAVFDIAVAAGWDQGDIVKKLITASDSVGISVIETLTGIKKYTWRVSPKKPAEDSQK